MRRPALALAAVLLLHAPLLYGQDVSLEQKLLVKGMPIGDSSGTGIAVSPDGRSGLLWGNGPKAQALFKDQPLAHLPLQPPVFLADGTPLFRAKLPGDEKRQALIAGGVSGPPFLYVSPPALSRDRKVFAYIATTGKDEYVAVLEGKTGEKYFRAEGLVLSPDGKRWAMVVLDPPGGTSERSHVVLDGVKGPGFRQVADLAFSADGAAFGYRAPAGEQDTIVIDGEKRGSGSGAGFVLGISGVPATWWMTKGGQSTIESNGKSRTYPSIAKVQASEDGRVVAFVAGDGKKSRVVVGEKEGAAYDDVGDLRVNRDGKRIVYTAAEDQGGKRRWLVVDGEKPENGRYDRIDAVMLAPSGGGYAYRGMEAGKSFVVTNGVRGPEGGPADGTFILSEDGKTAAYAARVKSALCVLHAGKVGPPFESIEGLALSPDGRSVAYVAGKYMLVVNGEKNFGSSPTTRWVGPPVFAPDGKKVACGVLQSGPADQAGLWWKVLPVR